MKLNELSKSELVNVGKDLGARVDGRMKPNRLIEQISKVAHVQRSYIETGLLLDSAEKDALLDLAISLDLKVDGRKSEMQIINLIIQTYPDNVDFTLLKTQADEPEPEPEVIVDEPIVDPELGLSIEPEVVADVSASLVAEDKPLIDKLEELKKDLEESEVVESKIEKSEVVESKIEKSTVDIRKHIYGIDGRSRKKIMQFEKITCEYLYKYGVKRAVSMAKELNAAPLVLQNLLAINEFWVDNGYLIVRNTWNSWMLRFDAKGFRE